MTNERLIHLMQLPPCKLIFNKQVRDPSIWMISKAKIGKGVRGSLGSTDLSLWRNQHIKLLGTTVVRKKRLLLPPVLFSTEKN